MTLDDQPGADLDLPPTKLLVWAYGALSACLAAGYGVLFTIVGDYRDAYGISETAIGVVIGVGFIVAFVSQILLGPIGDRGHARHLVIAGVVANAAGLLLMGFGDDLATITIGRVVSGAAIGAATPAIRRIVVIASKDDLGRNIGLLLSADVFGFALGPAVSAILVGPYGLAAPFIVVATGSVLAVAATLGVRVVEREDRGAPRLALDLLRIRPFAGAVVLGATAFLMIGAFDALWDLVHADLGTPTWLANLGITLFAVPLIFLAPIGGRAAQEIGPFTVAGVGLTLAAVFMFSYGFVPTGTWIFGVAMFHAVSDGLTFAASSVAVGMTIPPERQSGAQGVLGGAQALAAGIMAIITGALYEAAGRATAYAVAAALMIVLVAVGLWLGIGDRSRPPVTEEASASRSRWPRWSRRPAVAPPPAADSRG